MMGTKASTRRGPAYEVFTDDRSLAPPLRAAQATAGTAHSGAGGGQHRLLHGPRRIDRHAALAPVPMMPARNYAMSIAMYYLALFPQCFCNECPENSADQVRRVARSPEQWSSRGSGSASSSIAGRVVARVPGLRPLPRQHGRQRLGHQSRCRLLLLGGEAPRGGRRGGGGGRRLRGWRLRCCGRGVWLRGRRGGPSRGRIRRRRARRGRRGGCARPRCGRHGSHEQRAHGAEARGHRVHDQHLLGGFRPLHKAHGLHRLDAARPPTQLAFEEVLERGDMRSTCRPVNTIGWHMHAAAHTSKCYSQRYQVARTANASTFVPLVTRSKSPQPPFLIARPPWRQRRRC